MWRPELTGRPEGARLGVCVTAVVLSTALLLAAAVLLAAGRAGITLILLPAAFGTAALATYLLESSMRRAARAARAVYDRPSSGPVPCTDSEDTARTYA